MKDFSARMEKVAKKLSGLVSYPGARDYASELGRDIASLQDELRGVKTEAKKECRRDLETAGKMLEKGYFKLASEFLNASLPFIGLRINSAGGMFSNLESLRLELRQRGEKRFNRVIAKAKDPSNAVFNLHAPPYGSGLDEAPELTKDMRPAYAGRSLVPVGSRSVMTVIEKYEPLLGLHGHIHEGKGTRKFRKTLCINPGSMYEQGILHGAVMELKPQKVGNYLLTTG